MCRARNLVIAVCTISVMPLSLLGFTSVCFPGVIKVECLHEYACVNLDSSRAHSVALAEIRPSSCEALTLWQ